ncbi:ferritin-like domain-containing protein [Kinneretia aquatilis]|uniref:ferritin-like domain-containing protein n=1 Tax=Kinneretia aquatilis TaxID=2070761 RepID=UPI00149538AA|nr:ferritin-like domain-containing protein [Paucibacter aquatile]WIW00280.1 ferritin-like domain-containing protein [Paucibacter aquatile]
MSGKAPAHRDQEMQTHLALDLDAIEAVRNKAGTLDADEGLGPWREEIIALLNGALATELVCTLRYRRHHFTADGMAAPKIAEEFLVHANEELAHADRLARRIVQLGGKPDFAPQTLLERSHAAYDEAQDLKAMMRANLVAERVAIESYSQMIALTRDKDPATRRLLEDILRDEQEHAEELKSWLAD